MAMTLNFRSALGGFNREDVVNYIEYVNSKHTRQLNQLAEELEELRRKLEATPDLSDDVAALTSQLEETSVREVQLQQENQKLLAANAALLAQVEELKAKQADAAAAAVTTMELEAYRRAEQAERNAKLKAEQIYQQAVGTLAQATSQVDQAAGQFRQIAEQVNSQMTLLQQAVDSGKCALMDAANTMYSIRPEQEAL